ncbi:MAG TPA: C-GCAxxG-C-C family protein [Deltaproteobacteria bacterium]|nr:C-GCAxxG-C-C family protein [Deltaproteobacteria bacterium]
MQSLVQKRVRTYYWEHDLNCAATSLLILSELFKVTLSDQVLDSALGMHGAGEYGAQCGLVEGPLMFIGIIGRRSRISDDEIIRSCKAFAGEFEDRFSSLLCRELRPEGFCENNPPHLCEGLTCKAICSAIEFIDKFISKTDVSNKRQDLQASDQNS